MNKTKKIISLTIGTVLLTLLFLLLTRVVFPEVMLPFYYLFLYSATGPEFFILLNFDVVIGILVSWSIVYTIYKFYYTSKEFNKK